MPHLALTRKRDLSPFRRMAVGAWRDAYDPSVYGSLSLRMEAATEYMRRFREKTGRRVTISHLMCRALAEALRQMPDANAVLRFNRIYLRRDVSIFFHVAMDDGTGQMDLSGARIDSPEQKTLVQIVDDFEARVARVRARQDAALERTRQSFRWVPPLLVGPVLRAIAFLSYTLNLDLRFLGIPSDPFGSACITNVGSLGLDEAYVPLFPTGRTTLFLALGAVRSVPVVEGDAVVPGLVMRVHATFDHRLLDGSHAAVLARIITAYIENPFEHFDRLD